MGRWANQRVLFDLLLARAFTCAVHFRCAFFLSVAKSTLRFTWSSAICLYWCVVEIDDYDTNEQLTQNLWLPVNLAQRTRSRCPIGFDCVPISCLWLSRWTTPAAFLLALTLVNDSLFSVCVVSSISIWWNRLVTHQSARGSFEGSWTCLVLAIALVCYSFSWMQVNASSSQLSLNSSVTCLYLKQ